MVYERHGHTPKGERSKTYFTWQNMVARCTNENRPDHKYYGERGITVCDRWKNSFADFLTDMGEKPPGLSLERKNNSLGYYKENCKWATKHEQMQNTRATKRISFDGKCMGLAAWARHIGINKESLRTRILRGWSIEKALTTRKTR